MKTENSKNTAQRIRLGNDRFAILFTADEKTATIRKVESFMPPYEGLAPHVYMFVSYLSMLANNAHFFNKILSESFNTKKESRKKYYSRARKEDAGAEDSYQEVIIRDNQVLLMFTVDSERSRVRSARLITNSFNSQMISIYMFVEYLCELSCREEFFNEVLFDGYNKLFFSMQESGSRGSEEEMKKYHKPLYLKPDQLAIVFMKDKDEDAIDKVVTIIPPSFDRLSNVYAFVRSLSLLSTQEFFFKKILVQGFNSNFFDRRDEIKDKERCTRKPAGRYQKVMLSRRQFAIVFTADREADIITDLEAVYPNFDVLAPRVYMFIESLTAFMRSQFAAVPADSPRRRVAAA